MLQSAESSESLWAPPKHQNKARENSGRDPGATENSEKIMTELALELQARSEVPLYRQISSKIEGWIEEGRLHPGSQLASERKMTELLRVSRRTVRAALGDLINRGYVSATHGRGNFVLEPPRRREMRFLAMERFAPEPAGTPPWHYDMVHEAELKTNSVVHYKYAPGSEKLREIFQDPPTGYQGILLVRPSQEWLEALLGLEEELLSRIPVPLIIVNRDLTGSGLNFVSSDHYQCGYLQTRHLLELGHTRIGFISSSLSISYMRRTYDGHLRALEEAGLQSEPEDRLHCEGFGQELIEANIGAFLERRQFSAVAIAGSVVALPFERAIQRSPIILPDQLSAMLICEKYILEKLAMRWSAVIYPDEQVFQQSLQMLSELSWNQLKPPVQKLLPPVLVQGGTTSRCKN